MDALKLLEDSASLRRLSRYTTFSMFERWFGKHRKSLEIFQAAQIVFVGEQDGEPERALKQQLIKLFQQRSDAESAYLAIYRTSSGYGVVLCVTGVAESRRAAVAQVVGRIFSSTFNRQMHLDIIFPNVSQIIELDKVCRPFFVRDPVK